MARVCEICGKGAAMGNSVAHRGKAKYLGGVGTKITGITRRQFRPNLQKVHVSAPNGTHTTVRACTQCIRSGAVTKTVRNVPFRLPPGESVAKSKPEKPKSEKPKASQKRRKKKKSRSKKK